MFSEVSFDAAIRERGGGCIRGYVDERAGLVSANLVEENGCAVTKNDMAVVRRG